MQDLGHVPSPCGIASGSSPPDNSRKPLDLRSFRQAFPAVDENERNRPPFPDTPARMQRMKKEASTERRARREAGELLDAEV